MPRIRLKHRSLARALSESRISQNRWAQELGISRGHLSMLLSGRRIYPRPETRRKLMKGLGLPFEELFEAESRSTFNRPLPGKRATRMPALLGVAPSLGRLFRADDDRPGAGILGVMLGMAAAWGLFRFLGSLLFAVQPTDAATYLAAAAFITCASLAGRVYSGPQGHPARSCRDIKGGVTRSFPGQFSSEFLTRRIKLAPSARPHSSKVNGIGLTLG